MVGAGRSSASTVRRILTQDVIKPGQCLSWIFPRDPDFAARAGRVLDLSARAVERAAAPRGRLRHQRR